MLLGGKRPVHSHSSSQPLSSLYLWEKDQSNRDPCTLWEKGQSNRNPCTLELSLLSKDQNGHTFMTAET